MSADYPLASEHLVPRDYMFNFDVPKAIVIHKTAGDATPAAILRTFLNNPDKPSVHYGIGPDGTIWQYVPESLGAGGNGAVEPGFDPFWQPLLDQYGNLNMCTISIEHCDPATDNSTPLTPAQQSASFGLIQYLTRKYGLSKNQVKGHNSIDPVNRARCPGNYPWGELMAFLDTGGNMIPTGWHDDGSTLTAPNNMPVVLGFRDYVLSHNWDPNDYPLEKEHGQDPLELSNLALGGGTQQIFRFSMLGYTETHGVFFEWLGQELLHYRQLPPPVPQPGVNLAKAAILAAQGNLSQAQNLLV